MATATPQTETQTQAQTDEQTRRQPPYNVILLDDDDHTYEYVVEMLGKLFGHNVETALAMAREVDTEKRVIVLTTTMEHAELKRDQILGYGADFRLQRSNGSMKAVIEPAESDG